MKEVSRILIKPKYQKDNGVFVVDVDPEQVRVGGGVFRECSVVGFPPGVVGGNHKHPRVEMFACIGGKLRLSWIEGTVKHEEIMEVGSMDGLMAYLIPAHVPHVVENKGTEWGYLLEYASEKQHDVENVTVV